MTGEGKLVLIVEDDSSDALLLTHTLKKAGVTSEILHFTTGHAAKAYLTGAGLYQDRLAHPVPSVLFLDLQLPDLSGLELLRWIKLQPELRSVVVIVHSGFANSEEIDALYAAGARSFVRKSSEQAELRQVVHYFKGQFKFAP